MRETGVEINYFLLTFFTIAADGSSTTRHNFATARTGNVRQAPTETRITIRSLNIIRVAVTQHLPQSSGTLLML